MRSLILVASAVLAIGGTAAAQDQGAQPSTGLFSDQQVDHEISAARDWLKLGLVDFESARFRDVRIVMIITDRRNPRSVGIGVCGLVNARNRMGGYTGFKQFFHATALAPIWRGKMEGSAVEICGRSNRLNQTDYTARLAPAEEGER